MEAANHSTTRDEYAQAFQKGDEQALAFFYREFHPVLSLHAHRWVEDRSIAEEIASEALVKTWKMHWKLDSYGAIRAYLYKIVQRDSLDYIRKEKKRTAMHQQSQPSQSISDTPFDHVVRSEVYRIIHTALKDLSPANRKVIKMHYFEGKTCEEIADELRLASSTVRNQKMAALAFLHKKLKNTFLLFIYFSLNFFLQIS